MRKGYRRFFSILLILLLISFGTAVILTYIYEDYVNRLVETELKKHIQSGFKYDDVSLSLFDNPFQLTLSYENFEIESPLEEFRRPVTRIEKLEFIISVLNLFQGNYVVNEVLLSKANLQLKVNKSQLNNYENILNLAPEKKATNGSQLNFKVESIGIEESKVSYHNEISGERYDFMITDSDISPQQIRKNRLQVQQKLTLSDLNFYYKSQKIWSYPLLTINTNWEYQINEQKLNLASSDLTLNDKTFVMEGSIQKNESFSVLDLELLAKQNNLETVLALLPTTYFDRFADYKSEGRISWRGTLKGNWGVNEFPKARLDLEGKNVTIQSPNLDQKLENVFFQVSLHNGEKNSLETSIIKIDSLSGELANQPFRMSLTLSNFHNPYLGVSLDAGVDLNAFHSFFPLDNVEKVDGFLGVSTRLYGEVTDLKNPSSETEINAVSDINAKNVSFKLEDYPLTFENINGTLEINGQTAILTDFNSQLGNSDVAFQGEVSNFFAYLFNSKESLIVKGKVKSQKISPAEWFSITLPLNLDAQSTNRQYKFQLPNRLAFSLRWDADSLIFNKLKGKNFSADLTLKDQVLQTGNLYLQNSGGTIGALALLNAQKPDFIRLDGKLLIRNVQSHQFLESLGNLSQELLTSKKIRGRLNANTEFGLVFNQALDVALPHLVINTQAQVLNGAFSNFSPIKTLVNNLKTRNLNYNANLSFSRLETLLLIRNQTIFIPKMNIQTNPHSLSLFGRSTWADEIAYHVRVPFLQNRQNTVATPFLFYLSLGGGYENAVPKFTNFNSIETLNNRWERERKSLFNLFRELYDEDIPIGLDTVQVVLDEDFIKN